MVTDTNLKRFAARVVNNASPRAGADDKPGDEGNKEKVTFTPEQQAKIDELIREAMGRAGKEHKQTADTLVGEVNTLKQQLRDAEAKVASASTKKEKDAANEDVEALRGQLNEFKNLATQHQQEAERSKKLLVDKDKEIETHKNRALDTQKQFAMRDAASKVNFFDVQNVTKLTGDSISFDSDRSRFVVLNEQGQPRLNSAYEPMSLDEFYQEFAAKNPYMVRGDLKPGVGSTESQRSGLTNNGKYTVEQVFGKGSNSRLANDLAMKDPNEYKRLKAVAKQNGLIA
jgi:seryl-tRNA synthetase